LLEVYEAINKRKSIRKYKKEKISEKILWKILQAAHQAPSGLNDQPWKIIVVREENNKNRLTEATLGQNFLRQAPVVLAAVAMGSLECMYCGVPRYPIDVALALDHISIAAVEEGLGTCWVCAFNQDMVRNVLKVPQQYMVVALMSLGYPDDERKKIRKKTIQELVSFERFN